MAFKLIAVILSAALMCNAFAAKYPYHTKGFITGNELLNACKRNNCDEYFKGFMEGIAIGSFVNMEPNTPISVSSVKEKYLRDINKSSYLRNFDAAQIILSNLGKEGKAKIRIEALNRN